MNDNVVTFPNGETYTVLREVTQEARAATKARRQETRRIRDAEYNKTEARKQSKKLYGKTEAGKALKAIKDKGRDKRKKERRLVTEFWGIDTEGVSMHEAAWIEDKDGREWPLAEVSQDRQEQMIAEGGAIYIPQKIVVLAAGNDQDTHVLCKAGQGKGKDAPALSSIEMMKWLCELPKIAPKGTNFVWYAGSYDASHVNKGLPFELGWELARQMSFDNRAMMNNPDREVDLTDDDAKVVPDEPSIKRRVIWITTDPETGKPLGFAINYLKGKWLKIGMLRHPENEKLWFKNTKKGGYDYVKSVVIQDVVGFFQSTFLKAMDGMREAITISDDEQALIDWGKPLRGDFANQDIPKIVEYNRAEIVILARMMEAFRKALAELGLNPTKWHGPGVIAEMELKRRGIVPVKKRVKKTDYVPGLNDPTKTVEWSRMVTETSEGHYPDFLSANKTTVAQDWAHHAFSGGRIELVRQGVHCDPDNPIFQYDICSAYPAIILALPSQKGGKYKKHKGEKLTLDEFKAFIQKMNMLSMVQVKWAFDLAPRELTDKELQTLVMTGNNTKELDKRAAELRGEPVPFCPLFYRCNGDAGIKTHAKGTILYPSTGRGRYYRDEALAAIAWCEKFPDAVKLFEFEGAMEFLPEVQNPNERPFEFVQELFDKRSQIVADNETKPYNILEKVIKLILNSLYGKTAQSIGTLGEIPNCSNPFYAGAITAGTRAALLRAALHNPHGVVFFATDGIMSIGPLDGLETVEGKVLGEWEFAHELDRREAAVFVHPGIYSFFDHKGKPQTKTRGFKIDLARDFFMRDVVRRWKEGDRVFLVKKNGKRELIPRQQLPEVRYSLKKGETLEFENKLPMETTSFMTLGTAISSPDNWKKCGSWRTQNRDMNLQACGAKRMLCHDKDRAKQLVFVAPAENWEDGQLSAPYYPDWLDEDEGGLGEMKDEQNVEFKFGEGDD
jgi:hypothetical protein